MGKARLVMDLVLAGISLVLLGILWYISEEGHEHADIYEFERHNRKV